MKNVVVFIFIALITLINTQATIEFNTPGESTCEEGSAKATLSANIDSTSPVSLTFSITLVDTEDIEYTATCTIQYEPQQTGGRRILSYNKRKLDSTQVNCEFNQPEKATTLNYKADSISNPDQSTGNTISFGDDFSVSYQCGATQDSESSDQESDSDSIDISDSSDTSDTDVESGKSDETSSLSDEATEKALSDEATEKADETSSLSDEATEKALSDEATEKADETSSLSDETTEKTSEASTDAQTETEIVTPNTTISSDTDTEDNEELEKARKRLKITKIFRQVNKFTFTSNTITFYLYTLVTENVKAGEKITILVNLIKESGEIEEESKEITCSLDSDVNPPQDKEAQANFKCTLDGLTEPYYSVKLNSSEDITSIPLGNEISLDPVLTAEAIKDGKVLDYSLEENQKQDKIPPLFESVLIKEDTCSSDGKFLITGKLSQDIKTDLKFDLPVVYPEGSKLVCDMAKKEAGENQIQCLIDRKLDKDEIVIEQTIIKDGLEEVFIVKDIDTKQGITCSNGLLLEADKKTKINISFRQVSHFVKNGKNGFSFFLAALIKEKLTKGYSINIKTIILVKDVKKEKIGKCTLKNDVSPKSDEQVQGDFDCEVILDEEEYNNMNFTDPQSVMISPDNEEISGVSNLENYWASPIATDKAIEETKDAHNKNKDLPGLADCVDYSLDENKILIPPAFEIQELVNHHQCDKKGKFKLRGRFSSDIKKKMHFFLPLSFPASELKCKVYETPAGFDAEVICKVQKEFKFANSFVLEERMIKNMHKEMVFIKSKRLDFNTPFHCENYNKIKLELANKRYKADYSFLQLSKFQPVGKKAGFFMALTKKHKAPIGPKHFEAYVRYRLRLNNLRQLQEASLGTVELPVTCNAESEFDTAVGLNCLTDKDANGVPEGMELNTDNIEDIAGIPDDADPSKLNYAVDYSDPKNLELIGNLPEVEIESVDGSNCEEDGSYTIKGKVKKGDLSNYNNVEIPFGSPDSSGLCNITVKDKDVNMKCQNKEKFDISSVVFEPSVIQDSDNKEIFKLDGYYNQKRFACAMSVYSETPDKENSGNSTDFYNHIANKKTSGGLSGGAIAAIVICSVVALAIVAALKFYLSRSKQIELNNFSQNSSINQIDTNY